MAENIVTGADDVTVVIEAVGVDGQSNTEDFGRFIVDDFSLTRNESNELVHGISGRLPQGFKLGNVSYEFSWTMMGSDNDVFERVSTSEGLSRIISLTFQKSDDEGNIDFQYSLSYGLANSEEKSISTDENMNYDVDGIGYGYDRRTAE